MRRAVFTCLLCYIIWHIVLVSLAQRAYTRSLKWLSVVQIINANSATADLAFLLLAALSAQNIQSRPPRDSVSANILSHALRAQQRGGECTDLGSVSAFPKNLCITNPLKPIDHKPADILRY